MWEPATARASCRRQPPLPRRTERSMAKLELVDPVARAPGEPRSPGERLDRLDEMLSRYLGPAVIRAMADDDVTEVYVNPQDGAIRLDTRSRGKIASGTMIDAHRVEMFLNAVAARLGEIGRAHV